jgi:signal transduction histidine kinase
MRRPSLLIKLPALVVLAVILTAGSASLVALLVGRDLLQKAAVADNRSDLGMYADAIGMYLDSARWLLQTAVVLPDYTDLTPTRQRGSGAPDPTGNAASAQRGFASRRVQYSTVFAYVMLLRKDGWISLLEPYALEKKLSRRDLGYTRWYQTVTSTGQATVSELHISPATGRPTVVVAIPVKGADGRIKGIWAGGLKLEQLSRVGREGEDHSLPDRYGFLTDGRGLIIAHQARPRYVLEQTDFSMVPPVREALGGREGDVLYVSPIDGAEKLGAYKPLPGTSWAVVHEVGTEAAFAPVTSLSRGILWAAGGVTVVLGLLGLGVARRVVGPLGHLARAAHALGSGESAQRIAVRTEDEVGRLADEFNRMSVALAEKEAALRQRAEQLEAANKELEAFSYSVSHDLRAPLRAMDGFSRILIEDYSGSLDAEAKRYLGIVRDNTKHMGQLVDDLLAFSRLGREPLRIQAVAPARVAQQALEELRGELGGRDVTMEIGELPDCQADPALFKQVVVNLLSNAIKFTRKRQAARIEIGALAAAEGAPPVPAVYYVRDNGVGFDMRYADKLFGVFQRLHPMDEYEGTGVGLAIVQRIVHRHGGRVWAEAAVNQGATFYFAFDGQ